MREVLVADTRRLAAANVGPEPWARHLAQQVSGAGDDDLGTLVVARAVLARAMEEQAQRAARQREIDEQRCKAEAQAAAMNKAALIRGRRQGRMSRVRRQLFWRLTRSALYSAAAGYAMSTLSGVSLWAAAAALMVLCMVMVAGSLFFDWFAYSDVAPRRTPDGALRRICTAGGVLLGLTPWARLAVHAVSTGGIDWGEEVWVGPVGTYWAVAALPVSLTAGSVFGGMISLAVGPLEDPHHGWQFRRAMAFLWPFSWLGGISAIGAYALYHTGQWSRVFAVSAPAVIPRWHFPGVSDRPAVLIVLGTLALLLHYAAPRLGGRSMALGVAASVLGPVLGLLSLVVNPGHIVVWGLEVILRILM